VVKWRRNKAAELAAGKRADAEVEALLGMKVRNEQGSSRAAGAGARAAGRGQRLARAVGRSGPEQGDAGGRTKC
jgi:hypothetical protein